MRQPHHRFLVALLVVCLAASAGCDPAAGGSASRSAATSSSPAAGADAPATPAPPAGAPTSGVTSEPAPAAALPPGCTRLPLTRRAALVLVVGMPEVTAADDPLVDELTDLGVGGVFLAGHNVVGRQQFTDLTAALGTGRAPRPLITTDEEWGRVSSLRDLLGPTSTPRTIAATRTPAQVRGEARALGRALTDLGVDWNFAPLADVDAGPADGVIGDRAFSGESATSGTYARAFAVGMRRAGVLATVKHFPGHGAVPPGVDPHSRTVRSTVPMAELRRRHLPPFQQVIDAGVPVVMVNHVIYRALGRLPASMSPRAYRLLRATGFDGVAVTDSIGMGAVHRRWDFPAAAEQAIRAGADAVLSTDGRQADRMRRRLVAAVRAGRLPKDRLNEAVGRMLALRQRARPCRTD